MFDRELYYCTARYWYKVEYVDALENGKALVLCESTSMEAIAQNLYGLFKYEEITGHSWPKHRIQHRRDLEETREYLNKRPIRILKALRRQLALPYATLKEIALKRPRTLVQLGRIKGIGQIRLEKYGEAVLKVVDSFA